MQIRLAFPNEIDQIMLLIEEARAEIAKTGSDQWQKEDGYPNRNDIIDDILNGYAWVGIEDGMLATYAAVIDGHEEVYDAIYEGNGSMITIAILHFIVLRSQINFVVED